MISRKEFLALPMDERRRLLREEVGKAATCEACEYSTRCDNDPQKSDYCPLNKLDIPEKEMR